MKSHSKIIMKNVKICLKSELSLEDNPFSSAFSSEEIMAAFYAEKELDFRDGGPFSRDVTLFSFLTQVLSPDSSCRAAVERINASRQTRGLEAVSPHTSSYCKAREKLPCNVLKRLSSSCAAYLEDAVPEKWLWRGRHVKIIDATMLTAPATLDNLQAFPQHHHFRPGFGLASIRLVALTSLASGALLDAEIGAYEGGTASSEMTLARKLVSKAIEPGDIVLGDRYYGAYFFIATVLAAGGDFIGRASNGRRKTDFRRGIRLGKNDHIITLKKPKRFWMSEEMYNAFPNFITIREVKINRKLTVMTTLMSPKDYPQNVFEEIYSKRWNIELDLFAIKQIMSLDHLSCLTPGMAEKEIWAHLLGYNIIRKIMAEAAYKYNTEPRKISFKATIQVLLAWQPILSLVSKDGFEIFYDSMLRNIVKNRVGNRPDRHEPREVRRSRKKFPSLKHKRSGIFNAH